MKEKSEELIQEEKDTKLYVSAALTGILSNSDCNLKKLLKGDIKLTDEVIALALDIAETMIMKTC